MGRILHLTGPHEHSNINMIKNHINNINYTDEIIDRYIILLKVTHE